jgi:hypothetical protein
MSDSDKNSDDTELNTCSICEREKVSEEYCKYHDMAHQNVQYSYQEWEDAYGKLSLEDYLQKIIDNPATGIWAKEVAEDLLKKGREKKK